MSTDKQNENDEVITIDLSDEELETVARVFVSNFMSTTSQTHFENLLEASTQFKEALFQTCVNESINWILASYMDKLKSDQPTTNTTEN